MIICGPAQAVFAGQDALEEARKALAADVRRQATPVAPDAISGTPPSSAGLVAGDKDKRVFINYTIRSSDRFNVVLSASTPLAEQGLSTLTDVNGLSGKTRLGGQMQLTFDALPTPAEAEAIYNKLWPECQRLLAATSPTPSEVQQEQETGISERGCDYGALSAVDPKWFEAAIRPYRRVSWSLSLKAEIGPDTFEFVDATSFAGQTERRVSRSVSVSGGALLRTNVYLSLGLRAERAYANAKTFAVCTIAGAVTIACPSKVVGPPTEKTRTIIEGEARRFFGSHAGVSTLLRYDWKSGDKSLEIPVYLVQDKDGGLRGGVSYAHLWADEDASGHRFAVFVGQAFKLGG